MRKLILTFFLIGISSAIEAEPLTTIGWIEAVQIQPEGYEVMAKIDTGADNSSLDVTSWQAYSHNGSPWIRFEVSNNAGKLQKFERPLERYARIKRKRTDPVKRPVVKMLLCVGEEQYLVSVNLAERNNFKYRMLIGRSFLKNHFLVDVSKRETQVPKCNS